MLSATEGMTRARDNRSPETPQRKAVGRMIQDRSVSQETRSPSDPLLLAGCLSRPLFPRTGSRRIGTKRRLPPSGDSASDKLVASGIGKGPPSRLFSVLVAFLP